MPPPSDRRLLRTVSRGPWPLDRGRRLTSRPGPAPPTARWPSGVGSRGVRSSAVVGLRSPTPHTIADAATTFAGRCRPERSPPCGWRWWGWPMVWTPRHRACRWPRPPGPGRPSCPVPLTFAAAAWLAASFDCVTSPAIGAGPCGPCPSPCPVLVLRRGRRRRCWPAGCRRVGADVVPLTGPDWSSTTVAHLVAARRRRRTRPDRGCRCWPPPVGRLVTVDPSPWSPVVADRASADRSSAHVGRLVLRHRRPFARPRPPLAVCGRFVAAVAIVRRLVRLRRRHPPARVVASVIAPVGLLARRRGGRGTSWEAWRWRRRACSGPATRLPARRGRVPWTTWRRRPAPGRPLGR